MREIEIVYDTGEAVEGRLRDEILRIIAEKGVELKKVVVVRDTSESVSERVAHLLEKIPQLLVELEQSSVRPVFEMPQSFVGVDSLDPPRPKKSFETLFQIPSYSKIPPKTLGKHMQGGRGKR